ncbi:MAG: NAD-dependent protein deacylase [Peptococcaceae bacterium]|nr:NAD-dependent protein deacylase [Peptococcaceae bacterium]
MNAMQTLQQYIDESKRIVFFGGAGVSTESGIKDFRGVDGLYHLKYKYNPETILSRSFFLGHTDEFFEFYQDKIVQPTLNAAPNIAHKTLAKLEDMGKLTAVITQNIDGLHQMAGSRNVLELHGSIHRNYCMNCGEKYSLDAVSNADGIPRCHCGGIIRPDVVLYEEPLDDVVITKTVQAINNADLLIVGGTSLTVYPAAGFLDFYNGSKLVVINLDNTSYDSKAALTISGKIGEVLGHIQL